jgi:hypothetical protein
MTKPIDRQEFAARLRHTLGQPGGESRSADRGAERTG